MHDDEVATVKTLEAKSRPSLT